MANVAHTLWSDGLIRMREHKPMMARLPVWTNGRAVFDDAGNLRHGAEWMT